MKSDLAYFVLCLIVAVSFVAAMLFDIQQSRADAACRGAGFDYAKRTGYRDFYCGRYLWNQ